MALLLPANVIARALASATVPETEILLGVLFFKLLLAFHAIIVLLLSRHPPSPGPTILAVAPRSDEEKISRRTAWVILGGLLLGGGVLRLVSLDAGLWHDEIATYILYARRPASEIVSLYDSQNQHPLYSLLAHVTFALLGDSETALRLPAVLAGVGSLAAAYWFARKLVTRTEALLATALLVASYHHVWFSQNARGYTLLLLLTILGTGLFLRLLVPHAGSRQHETVAPEPIRAPNTAQSWAPAVGYAVVMALAVYTHLSAGFVVGAHAVVWLAVAGQRMWRGERRLDARPPVAIVLATTFSLQLYAFVMPQLLHTLFEKSAGAPATEWRSPFWLLAETARGLTRGLPGGWLAVMAGCVVAAAGTWSYARRAPAALALMVLPPLVVAAIMLALQHNLWPRLFFFAAAFAVLIVVRGVFACARLLSRPLGDTVAAVALALAAVGSALTVPGAWGAKQDFRGAMEYVERERASEDAVAAVGLSDLALVDYLRADWARPRTLAELREIEQAHPRTWAVYTFPTHLASRFPEIDERLRREYRIVATFRGTVGDGAIYVLVR